MIIHIVLFKFKKNICLVSINRLEKEFFNLKGKIPAILLISGGSNISKENLDKGFSKSFSLFFKDIKSLNSYLISKEHKDFVDKYVSPVIDDVIVFDYKI
jgi:hypothetical protein